MAAKAVLLVVALAALACVATAQKPGTFSAAYHYLTCSASAIVVPSSTAELANVIKAYYAQARTGTPVTIRASRPKFHSSAYFPCPITPAPKLAAAAPRVTTEKGPAKGPVTVGIIHSKLDKLLSHDPKALTMTVGAGMDLNKYMAAATKVGMSVQIGSLTAYAGLTLSGIFATSAHGSGDMTTSDLEDTLLSFKYVDGTGTIRTMTRKDPEWKAWHGGLGLLGIITEMTFQMTKPTNTQLITWSKRDDKDLARDIPKMLDVGKHILIFWRPDIGKYTAFITRPAAANLKPNPAAQMTLLPNIRGQPNITDVFRQLQEKLPDDVATMELLCPASQDSNLNFAWASVGNKAVENVTGLTNKMQASECDMHCLWNDPSVTNGTTQDVEFTVDHSRLNEWISAVKRIFKYDMWENGKTSYRCPGPGYLWIRFGEGDDGWMSTMHDIKRPVYLQSTWLRARGALQYPIRYQYVLDLIEEVTLCRFKGRPHWGKNFDRTFTHPRCPIRPLYPNMGKVIDLQKKYDPAKMYEPALFNKVANRQPYKLTPRCSVTQSCFCEADIHCVQGMKCVPALSFPEYKVCKYIGPNLPNSTIDITQLFDAMNAGAAAMGA